MEILLPWIAALDRRDLAAALGHRLRRAEANARARIVCLGRRGDTERMAHPLCALRWRLAVMELVTEDGFATRITQNDPADTCATASACGGREAG